MELEISYSKQLNKKIKINPCNVICAHGTLLIVALRAATQNIRKKQNKQAF